MDSNEISDEKDNGTESQINLPESVMSRIEELMGGTDEFDSADFECVSYINRVFPTEQSLCGVEAAAARCEYWLAQHAAAARRLLPAQHQQREEGQKALHQARKLYGELAEQINSINQKAERSESMVRSITAEMKQLDRAKCNLTSAIACLTHYRLLASGGQQLCHMAASRRYKEIAPALQALTEVLAHFSRYDQIPELSALREKVHDIRRQLAKQIMDDFKNTFNVGAAGGVSHRTLADACLVVDVLEQDVRKQLLSWLIDLQLQEYKVLFSAEQESAWLGSVEKRYTWLKKTLMSFERSLAPLCPAHWHPERRLARGFCLYTRSSLSELMRSRRADMDVNLLLFAVHKTRNFELLLEKRFQVPEEEGTEAEKQKPAENEDDPTTYRWLGSISCCFEAHLSLYTDSVERSLRTLLDQLLQESKGEIQSEEASTPLSGCGRLLSLYKQALLQCTQLSNGDALLDLTSLFQKYLSEYATTTLQSWLPRAAANWHALLRDDAKSTYTKQEITKITGVITTAEYCLESTVHLEQKLKEKVLPEYANRIDLTPEQDLFHKTISNSIQLLVQDLELTCEPALQSMTKISWVHFDTVGDQSSYITQIIMLLKNYVPILRDNLSSSRKFFTQFCIRFANSFIPKFIQNVYKCKPISTVGSEQLLLDTHMLKTALLELPSIGSDVKRPAPATYTKVVIKLMSKAEMILKLVMAPLDNNLEGFVAQFVQLLPEATLAEFHKVLDMKGAKLNKAQQSSLDALFKRLSKGSEIGNQ